MENTLKDRVRNVGSLRGIDHAVRLVYVLGGTVCGYAGLTVYTVEAGAIEFEERSGRIWPK